MRVVIHGTRTRRIVLKAIPVSLLSFLSIYLLPSECLAAGIDEPGISVIPYPKKVESTGGNFIINAPLHIILNKKHSAADEFTAQELARDLKTDWDIDAVVSNTKQANSIVLVRKKMPAFIGGQGYQIDVNKNEIIISASGEEGLFYGTQTFLQLIQPGATGFKVPGVKITDSPDIPERAVHYDTKHHQDKMSYVKTFIKDLARYKVNMFVWEWEDKFAYPSHPEIGAPGAFTPAEIQELTNYAAKYYIQLVPLVQGLGHSSYILKWPQFAHLREIPASNFEFCPLKEGSYELLFDLWKDAMEATKGSKYIHIGSDETYELGVCENCSKKAAEISKSGLYHLFGAKAADYIKTMGRKAMIWESPGWIKNNPGGKLAPNKNLVFTEEDRRDDNTIPNARSSKKLGYEVFFYDPNPGIEPLFLPYDFKVKEDNNKSMGALEDSYNALKQASKSKVYDGMIRTSWDDAGLHNQMWMLSFATAAAYSWNGDGQELTAFKKSFFNDYYGSNSSDIGELYTLFNEGAYYYWDMLERKVWHWGEIGNTFMPDLPRNDAVEYDPFWNTQYKDKIERSTVELKQMERALEIIAKNKKSGVRHPYDFELFESMANLIKHTCLTYTNLSKVENYIKEANRLTFIDRDSTHNYLMKAVKEVETCLERRTNVMNDLITTWEKSRLPKGLSTPEKNYFFQQDRTRHFANRRPDMSYLIYDEQLLNMEDYLDKLKIYADKYRKNEL